MSYRLQTKKHCVRLVTKEPPASRIRRNPVLSIAPPGENVGDENETVWAILGMVAFALAIVFITFGVANAVN